MLLAVGLCWAAGGAARAVPSSSSVYSLEWLVAKNELVVVGEVGEVRALDPEPVPGGGAAVQRLLITIRVGETIKGSARREVTFAMRRHHYVYNSNDLDPSRGGELLIGLNPMPQEERGHWGDSPPDYFLATFSCSPLHTPGHDFLPLNADTPMWAPMLTEKYPGFGWRPDQVSSWQHARQELLEAARQAAADGPGRAGSWSWGDPAFDHVVFPLNARTERLARHWVMQDFPAEDRARAIRFVLAEFPGPANTQLLKRLLEDAQRARGKLPTTPGPYPVRSVALRTLQQWGVAIPDRILTEPPLPQRSLSLWRWLALVIAVALLGAWIFLRRKGHRPGAGGALLVVLLIGALWLRSVWHVDWLHVPAGQVQCRLASAGGRLYCLLLSDSQPDLHSAWGTQRRSVEQAGLWEGPGQMWSPISTWQSCGLMVVKGQTWMPGGLWGASRLVSVPHWWVMLLVATLAVLGLNRWRVSRRRRKLGLCLVCGYDLRASVGRCPECGTLFTQV